MEWENGVNWLYRPDSVFLAILGQSWPNFCPKWPTMTLSSQFLEFSCKICTQRMKLYKKVVLFTSMLFDKESTLWRKLANFEGQNPLGMSGNIPSKFFHELSSLIAIGIWLYFCWDSLFYIWSEMISLSTCCDRYIHNS